ncbi:hypothetical protein FHR72_001084 [Mycolicibacterium iranicum]|uniref:DUF732 domain-containing protein n=1 Tax=Mycolicibacterium iranicum TaxID=912594 RepID=A0A839QAN6_MYCIR|nr:DUF732 domain-containing protein [Mycolicibacterium iranicum]MBB2989621.1 hypothetical protein [Mycolicibacterium iranicum]
MRLRIVAGLTALVVPLALAPTASADLDTDFNSTLQTVGIYGQKDYHAWLAKITCKRLATGVDAEASESVAFLTANLAKPTTTEQAWQFLGTALRMYCPDRLGVLPS